MKRIITAVLTIFLLSLGACSKTENSSSITRAIAGEWAFRSQFIQSFSYPSVLTNPTPVSISNWAVSNDSIKIRFDGSGNYSFKNFRLPADNGTYKIVQDSLLIIKPDTSGFIKFCYSSFNFYVSSSIVTNFPTTTFHFNSDTIILKKAGSENLELSTFWLTRATIPIQPSQDTILLNQSRFYFKRL